MEYFCRSGEILSSPVLQAHQHITSPAGAGRSTISASLLEGRPGVLLKCKWHWVRQLVKPPRAPGPVEFSPGSGV